MSVEEADHIQALLTRLMDGLRQRPALVAEIARAEREFFQANPTALETDPSARFRFQEWYILERESEVLGDVPVTCIPMTDDERELLDDSLLGVFRVTNANAAEYILEDLQGLATLDLGRMDSIELQPDDLLVGRLFIGSLDTHIASPVLCCQRGAQALAEAFRRDVAKLDLDRRLTQAEIEHLMFRGRGSVTPPVLPDDVPLEHIEADLESCLLRGGADAVSATSISAALRGAVRPGMIMNPLLEKLAFDTDVDIELAQRLMVQIWDYHQARAVPEAPADPPDPSDMPGTPDESDLADLPDPPRVPGLPDLPVAPDLFVDLPAAPPAEPPAASGSTESERTGRQSRLGAEVARRLQQGMENEEDMSEVFADIDRMVGEADHEGDADAAAAGSGEGISEGPSTDGDLRPLIVEYLWETGRGGSDPDILEQWVRVQCEASVPRLDLESITSLDLVRVLLQSFLASPPGGRSAAVGETFGAIERFYTWAEQTQQYELGDVLEEARACMVDHAVRLETAALALGATEIPDPAMMETETGRGLFRVVTVAPTWIEVAPDESDNLVRIAVAPPTAQQLREDDLLLGNLRVAEDRIGSFAGMVVAMPLIAHDLLG